MEYRRRVVGSVGMFFWISWIVIILNTTSDLYLGPKAYAFGIWMALAGVTLGGMIVGLKKIPLGIIHLGSTILIVFAFVLERNISINSPGTTIALFLVIQLFTIADILFYLEFSQTKHSFGGVVWKLKSGGRYSIPDHMDHEELWFMRDGNWAAILLWGPKYYLPVKPGEKICIAVGNGPVAQHFSFYFDRKNVFHGGLSAYEEPYIDRHTFFVEPFITKQVERWYTDRGMSMEMLTVVTSREEIFVRSERMSFPKVHLIDEAKIREIGEDLWKLDRDLQEI